MNNLQKELEFKLDHLLELFEKIKICETVSPHEQTFIETLKCLYKCDSKIADEYSQKYNEIIVGRDSR